MLLRQHGKQGEQILRFLQRLFGSTSTRNSWMHSLDLDIIVDIDATSQDAL